MARSGEVNFDKSRTKHLEISSITSLFEEMFDLGGEWCLLKLQHHPPPSKNAPRLQSADSVNS